MRRKGRADAGPLPQTGRRFTLIELLVAIAIIGVLAALLLPSLERGKALAKGVQCLSNTRQLALALVNYGGDHDGFLRDAANGIEQQWVGEWLYNTNGHRWVMLNLVGWSATRYAAACP